MTEQAPATRTHEAIEALARAVADAGPAFQARMDAVGAESALRRLADALDANQAALDAELFPAMAESVAGSDPVCIRAMQRHLSDLHSELSGHVLGIGRQPGAGARLQALLLAGCAQYLAYQREEVFPMAERLLAG